MNDFLDIALTLTLIALYLYWVTTWLRIGHFKKGVSEVLHEIRSDSYRIHMWIDEDGVERIELENDDTRIHYLRHRFFEEFGCIKSIMGGV